MKQRVTVITLGTNDLRRARAFYEETLGLKLGSHGHQGDKWWIEYDLPGGGCLALTNFTGEQPSASSGGTPSAAGEAVRSLPLSTSSITALTASV